jgi:hypothetical protein
MRVIVRKEVLTPAYSCASPTLTGTASPRSPPTLPAGNSPTSNYATAARARAEDRIRTAKDTGLRNLPLHDFTQNQIWCAIVALACELTAWIQLLAFTDSDGTTHEARRWEPKRLRLRLFSTAARIARTGRRTIVHLAHNAAYTRLPKTGLTQLRALAAPG